MTACIAFPASVCVWCKCVCICVLEIKLWDRLLLFTIVCEIQIECYSLKGNPIFYSNCIVPLCGVSAGVFVGHCLATKVVMGKLPIP